MAGVGAELVETSFMPMVPSPSDACLPSRCRTACAQAPTPERPRLYGKPGIRVHTIVFFASVTVVCLGLLMLAQRPGAGAAEAPVKVVALGDSLTAGFGLTADAAFPTRLQAALKAKGIAVEIANAGVSGDTASGGLARLDWSVPEGTEAVILELGANDALRGIAPSVTRAALDAILGRLAERRIPVLLAGMRAPRNMGADYTRAFDAIFPDLAAAHDAVFYPFFLDGVAAESRLNLADGLHPTAAGIDIIVARILPKAEELIARARAKRGS
jgi:acyl-CoA thioesterase I